MTNTTEPTPVETVLSLRGICKQFGAVSALTDIDLDVRAGEVVALVGDNGAGKSTLVKVLAGVHAPTSGSMMFLGKPVSLTGPGEALSLGIATVFQDLALCENLDVVANIFLGRELGAFALDEVTMEIRAWTLLNELAARIPSVREPIASLSGGQRQTVAIARSLLLEPKLIMLDEPTAALGVAQTAEVLNLIERVRERGLGVIMISHNMEDVRAVADRIVVLRLGRNNGVFYPRHLEPGAGQRHHRGLPTIPSREGRAVRRGAHPQGRHAREQVNLKPGPAALDRADDPRPPRRGVCAAPSGPSSTACGPGDLGSLPVVVGLAVIWTVFQTLNPVFLSANNLVNLLFDCSTVGVISLGIVCILMVGEIDLSVGSVSRLRVGDRGRALGQCGLAGGGRDPPRACWPAPRSASVYAVLFNRLGMPSFVSTLAGLLAVLGLQLYILGSTGSINLPYGSAS